MKKDEQKPNTGGRTELYFLRAEETSRLPETYFREHFSGRFARAGKFRFEADRLRCLGAGVLLTEVLGAKEDKLLFGPQGKPYLPGNERKFNVSHSGEYIVLAVSESEIGADIEKKDERHLDVAKRVFLPEELEWMEEDPVNRFFELWCLKESVMKACGKGFMLPPDSFSVLPAIRGDTVQIGSTEYRASVLNLFPDYGLAFCLKDGGITAETGKPDIYELKPENGRIRFQLCQQ